jgi:hypothetical protein
MVLHFQAIQPGQQDRRRQARGEKVDRRPETTATTR